MDAGKKELLQKYCRFSTKKLLFNEDAFQDINSDTCGKFVLYFGIERMHNLDLTFEEILEDLFEIDQLKNEEKVKQFYEFCLQN